MHDFLDSNQKEAILIIGVTREYKERNLMNQDVHTYLHGSVSITQTRDVSVGGCWDALEPTYL